jgi:hypothetical protein
MRSRVFASNAKPIAIQILTQRFIIANRRIGPLKLTSDRVDESIASVSRCLRWVRNGRPVMSAVRRPPLTVEGAILDLKNYFFSMVIPRSPTFISIPVVFCRSW